MVCVLQPKSTKARTQLIQIGLIETNPLAALHLKRVLQRDRHIHVFSAGFGILDRNLKKHKSIVVIDIGSIKQPTSRSLAALHRKLPGVGILALGEEVQQKDLDLLLRLGVRGFVPYGKVESQLREAIRALSVGDLWIPRDLLHQMLNKVIGRGQSAPDEGELTHRERLVVQLLEKRLSNKEIGNELLISLNTVKFHLSNIFRKLGVNDRYSAFDASIATGDSKADARNAVRKADYDFRAKTFPRDVARPVGQDIRSRGKDRISLVTATV